MDSPTRLNPSTLQAPVTRVQQDIDAGLPFGGIEAASLAIAHGNEVLFEHCFGRASPASTFLMFSISKTLLDAALWRLFDDGLSPGASIDSLVPGFMGGAAPEITIRRVQAHLGCFAWQPLGYPQAFDRDHRLHAFTQWRPEAPPGSRYEYHPLNGSWVLAEVIERVSGMDYRAFIRRQVIEPLGLAAFKLDFGCDAAQAHDILLPIDCSRGWTPDASQRRVACEIDTLRGASIGIPGIGGVSTAAGVAMLYQAFLSNPAQRWREQTLDDARYGICVDGPDPMGRPVRRTSTFLQAGAMADRYGERMFFGPRVSERAFGHQGQGGQVAWADPESGLSFCFLTNTIVFPPGGCYHPRASQLSTLAAQVLS